MARIRARSSRDHGDAARLRLGLEATANIPSIELREHDVEQDQVGAGVSCAAHDIATGRGDEHGISFMAEVVAQELRDVGLIFDNEDSIRPRRRRDRPVHEPQRRPRLLQEDDGEVNLRRRRS